jgi:hypothetical protein
MDHVYTPKLLYLISEKNITQNKNVRRPLKKMFEDKKKKEIGKG